MHRQCPQYHHDERLHQAGEVVDQILHVGLKMLGNFFQHLIQGARFFTDRGHLDRHAGEQAAMSHGVIQLHACGYVVTHLFDRLFEQPIARCTRHGIQSLHQGHARCKSR